jgi:N-acetylmuramoyl-L-alanine amidase
VPLRDRTNFANKQRADLFVSIHANAHPARCRRGGTYFLSSEASDTESRQTAAIENGGPPARVPGRAAEDRCHQEHSLGPRPVRVPAGVELPRRDRAGLDDPLAAPRQPRSEAGGLLRAGRRRHAAILIEIGFLTNPKEEKKLSTPEYREATARAIFTGLSEYKRRYDQRMRTALSRPGGAATR